MASANTNPNANANNPGLAGGLGANPNQSTRRFQNP